MILTMMDSVRLPIGMKAFFVIMCQEGLIRSKKLLLVLVVLITIRH